jgi:hypothetical protein
MLEDSSFYDCVQYCILNNVFQHVDFVDFAIGETPDSQIILFVINHDRTDNSITHVEFKVVNNATQSVAACCEDMKPGHCYWYMYPKQKMELDCFVNNVLVKTIHVDPVLIYSSNLFYFADHSIQCISEWPGIPKLDSDFYEKYDKIQKSYVNSDFHQKYCTTLTPSPDHAISNVEMNNSNIQNVVFVTCADTTYMSLAEVLVKSMLRFSQYKIIVYGINCDIPFDYSNMIKARVDQPFTSKIIACNGAPLDLMMAKITVLRDVVEKYSYSDYVYIDSDSIATQHIDGILKYTAKVDNYPLINSHLFDWIILNNQYINRSVAGLPLSEELKVSRGEGCCPWLHANLMVFNQKCKWFFDQVEIEKNNLIKGGKEDILAALCDEALFNVLLWKYQFKEKLPVCDYDSYNVDHFNKFFKDDIIDYEIGRAHV